MGFHEWRRRRTKHLGEVWVPFAQIETRSAAGTFRPVFLQIDSGAAISLLRRSFADLLGIDLAAGRRIELGSVGGSRIVAFVHEIETRFADQIVLSIPYAISEIERVPNLLGRLGVFENLRIEFDPLLRGTTITLPKR